MKTNFDDSIYYYKDMSRKKINDFDNAINFFKKIEDCDTKLEEGKNDQNIFKLNLNQIKKQGLNHKSKIEQYKILTCFIMHGTNYPIIW